MTLREQQSAFVRLLPALITYANQQGYELTLGDAYRDPRCFGYTGESKGYGARNSLHKLRLAVDLNLFKDGVWLRTTNDHRFLGVYWESLDPHCRWGGRFQDGNHYEWNPER